MKLFAAATVIATASLLAGCSASWHSHRIASADPGLNSHLLFDAYAGQAHAGEFTGRRDWPSTEYGYTLHERVRFSEQTYDYQGRNHQGGDIRRRFTTRRSGVIDR